MPGHRVVIIEDQAEARMFLDQIGVDPGAYPYMQPKALYRCIKLKNISCRAANIIKQEMLSKGGEAAIKRDALKFEGFTDVLLMGHLKHYRLLTRKLRVQPFGLKDLAGEIEAILENWSRESWTIPLPGGRVLELGGRPYIMGILNVTPDSFSDGGRFYDYAPAIERARMMREEGADIIDVGGASTRPDARIVDEEEELRRILPVVEKIVSEGAMVSVDTFRGRVARECLEAGAHMINDIGALRLDPELLPVLAEYQAPSIFMHNRLQIDHGKPYQDLVADIVEELEQAVQKAEAAGLKREKIMLDPGLGFGKDPAQNRLLLKRLKEFKGLGLPLVVGASRKRFIGATLNLEVAERLEGSLAVVAVAVMNGAQIIRVHDVKESVRVAAMTDAVVRENG
mgnify:CR=1 FL=1